MYQNDFSQNLRRTDGGDPFSIPVFEDENDLNAFIDFIGNPESMEPGSDGDEQTNIFYALVDQYNEFRGQS